MPSNCGSSTRKGESRAKAKEQGLDQNKAFSLTCKRDEPKWKAYLQLQCAKILETLSGMFL